MLPFWSWVALMLSSLVFISLFTCESPKFSHPFRMAWAAFDYNWRSVAIKTCFSFSFPGWIYDASGSYTASFIIHGVIIGISGLVLAVLKLALARSKRLDVAAAIAAAAVAVTGVTNEAFVAESSAWNRRWFWGGILWTRKDETVWTQNASGIQLHWRWCKLTEY